MPVLTLLARKKVGTGVGAVCTAVRWLDTTCIPSSIKKIGPLAVRWYLHVPNFHRQRETLYRPPPPPFELFFEPTLSGVPVPTILARKKVGTGVGLTVLKAYEAGSVFRASGTGRKP